MDLKRNEAGLVRLGNHVDPWHALVNGVVSYAAP